MKIPKPLQSMLAAVLSAALLVPGAVAADGETMLREMRAAKESAAEYEIADRYEMAYRELTRYADLAGALAKTGDVSPAEADMAQAWRDHLRFAPEIFVECETDDGVFFGSDGVFAEGSSAVKISIPYGAYAEDLYPTIPSVTDELLIYTELEVTNERTLRQIAFGKADDYVIKNLRQIARMEGRVYFAFSPGVNTLRETRTLPSSFISAYRYVAKLARRYAPNVELVFAVGDVRDPGRDTVARFYPGDEWVDALGAELYHTYSKSYMPSPKAAYDCRGEYYDPVQSVLNIRGDVQSIAEKDLPVIISGCSFPWGGRAALDDWAEEMKRFYRLIPVAVPELVGVLYSNESTANGFCNLRQNSDAMALYRECLEVPWYINHNRAGSTKKAVSVEKLDLVKVGDATGLHVLTTGKFSGVPYRIFFGSKEYRDGFVYGKINSIMTLYITDNNCLAKMQYKFVMSSGGECSVTPVQADHDFNGNGYLDFGDTEVLSAYIARWDVDMNGYSPDVNGDGIVNLTDVSALRVKMKP